jgi:hypothetical protein
MKKGLLGLYWKDRLVGTISDVHWSDFPWLIGKIALRRLTRPLRQALEYVSSESNSVDGLRDWPFAEELFWNWAVLNPDGSRKEIGIPIVDFATGYVEWR